MIRACTLAVDASFLTTLLSGVSVSTSTGQTAESVRSDLAALLAAVPTDQSSRLFLVTTPLICKMWSAMGATSGNGSPAFENVTPQGGSIMGIPILTSDAVTAGQVVLVDATGIAAGSDTIVLNVMAEGTIMPDSAPELARGCGDECCFTLAKRPKRNSCRTMVGCRETPQCCRGRCLK